MSFYNVDENKNMIPFAGANRCIGVFPTYQDSSKNPMISQGMLSLYDWFVVYTYEGFSYDASSEREVRVSFNTDIPAHWLILKFGGGTLVSVTPSFIANDYDWYFQNSYTLNYVASSGVYSPQLCASFMYCNNYWRLATQCYWIVTPIKFG